VEIPTPEVKQKQKQIRRPVGVVKIVTAVQPTGSGGDIKTLVAKYGNHVVQGKSLAELDKLIEEIMVGVPVPCEDQLYWLVVVPHDPNRE